MVSRAVRSILLDRLSLNPSATLLGPRQSGKTTLAKSLGKLYFDLEKPEDRSRLDFQWNEVRNSQELVVLDEAQAWPQVFPRLRAAIDEDRARNGRFLLLGSVSPSLMKNVSESLAGRMALVELTPLLLKELPQVPMVDLWVQGGYPAGGILGHGDPAWKRDYLALLAQRDLPAWGLPARPEVIDRLLRMLAYAHAQPWNATQIGQGLGLSYHTVNEYLDYLLGAFLIRRLQPYFANLRKRVAKTPKVYWRDSGLLHALHGIADLDRLLVQPWVGASWEGFVIEQVLGALSAMGMHADPYYLRTPDKQEIDLLLDFGRRLWAIEVKLTSAPAMAEFAEFEKAADLAGADRRILVCRVDKPIVEKKRAMCSLTWLVENLGQLLES